MNNNISLNRALGLTTAILLVISSMIGSGIFKKIAPMSSVLGDGNLILLAWIIAGVVSLFGVFTYSGLATLTEEGGGQFEYFRIIYGKFFAFIFGWTCFTVIQTASIASIAYVFGESVNNLVHFQNPTERWSEKNIGNFVYPFANSGVKLFTIFTIVVLTVINIYGVKKGGLLNDIFSSAKIIGIILLIVLGLALSGNASENSSLLSNTEKPDLAGFALLSAMFTAMLAAFWAYDGWINIAYIGGEVKNPKRNIPIAFIGGTAVVLFIYVLLNYAYLKAMPVDAYMQIDAEGNKIAGAEMAKTILGNGGFILISVLIMLCTFGATNSSLMSSPRIYFQMAKEKLFFKDFGKIHTNYKTPHRSLIYQALWASVLVVSGTFDQLTDMLIFASFIFYGSGAIGLMIMKRKGIITKKIIGYPVIPIVFILFCIVLVGNALYSTTTESLIGLLFLASSIPLYFYLRKKNKTA